MNKNNNITILNNLKKLIVLFQYRKKEWKNLKKKSQIRIKKKFSIEKMAHQYLENWNL